MSADQIFTIRGLRSKLEVTEGVDAAPAAADAMQVINGEAKIKPDTQTRNIDQRKFGSKPFLRTNKRWTASYGIELVGHGTQGTAPPTDAELQNSGHALTLDAGPPLLARYNPITNGIISATKEFYHNGELLKALGCRSVPTGMSFGIDVIPVMNINSTGFVVPPTEIAVPDDSLAAFEVPLIGSTESLTITLDSFPVDGVTLDLSFGTNLFLQRHSEKAAARLTQRDVTGTLRLFRPSYAAKNIRNLVETHATVPLVLTQTLAGQEAKGVKLTLGKVQLGDPQTVDIDGIAGWDLPLTFIPTAGDDDYILEFGT